MTVEPLRTVRDHLSDWPGHSAQTARRHRRSGRRVHHWNPAGTLLENLHRVGNALHRELTGVYSARRGAFRILYEIDDEIHLVTVLRVEHRADVYRPR